MASKIDMFLNHMRSNPEKAMTVYEIMHRFDVTNVTAYSWANHKYVKEERMGAKPKRVIFNSERWNNDHNGTNSHRSVDKEFTKAADSLSGELRAAHTNCIKFSIPSEEIAATIVENILSGKLNVDLKEEFIELKEDIGDKQRVSKFKAVLLSTHRAIEYLEKKHYGN